MSRALAVALFILCLIISVSASENDFSVCNCEEEGFWGVISILECQKVSDFLIAVAYFSIPIELLYFISCSNVPFKWVLLQFIAFIVLCGLTHLLNAWTYYGPHSFQLMLSLTIAKFLTALVSCATAITLLTLIPLLLKVKVRELFLRQNVLELDQEVGMMKKQKEASWHVRMLTREIRKSLDKHTILYTTLVELSKTLDLINCAVWMPNETRTEMNLTHELKTSSSKTSAFSRSIPIEDSDVLKIKTSEGVRILSSDSALGAASKGDCCDSCAVAAIRMPLLQVSNFKGGTPEMVDTRYAILVLVLPSENSRVWSCHDFEIVEVVADQVAVALSHAAVLEESQMMREQLSQQNRALQQAKENAMMASKARNSFQKVMSHGMRWPMHSILGLLSMLKEENSNSPFEQRIIVDTMLKTGNVLSALINDVMELSTKENGQIPLEMKPFQLHSMIREASCLAKCFCLYKGFGFEVDVQSSLPDKVVGDERRTFQVILHMVGNLLKINNGRGVVTFRVFQESGSKGNNSHKPLEMWKSGLSSENIQIKFEIEMSTKSYHSNDGSISLINSTGWKHNSDGMKEGLSFTVCKKLAKMMQGDIWISLNSSGFARSMTLVLRFQIRPSEKLQGNSVEEPNSIPNFNGLRVMLADDDDVNRTVTKKLLEKLGCEVMAFSSGFACLTSFTGADNPSRILLLDLHMPEIDGFEVAMRIRKFSSRNQPFIIALTASADEHEWERCLQMGMNGVIRKPLLLHGLANELKRVLQESSTIGR